MKHPNEFIVLARAEPCAAETAWPRKWRYAGRSAGAHVWEGACGCCGRWTTVRASDDEVAGIERDLEAFGDLECHDCADDRMHELDHIARGASDAEYARIVQEVPFAGAFLGTEQECAYRAWCSRRMLAPLPARLLRPMPASGSLGAAGAGISPA